jgi:hypothetical protein
VVFELSARAAYTQKITAAQTTYRRDRDRSFVSREIATPNSKHGDSHQADKAKFDG